MGIDLAVVDIDLATLVSIAITHQQRHRQVGQPRQLQPGGDVVFGYAPLVGRDQQVSSVDDARGHGANQLVLRLGHGEIPG